MNIDNYEFFSLFKENVRYSKPFRDVLINIASNGDIISKKLLSIEEPTPDGCDMIDISDDENLIAFIPNGKSVKSSVRTGRIVQKICNEFELEYSNKNVEDFVNRYKSEIGYKNESNKFKIVSGEEIRTNYLKTNYYNQNGSLGKSCMNTETSQKFLDIYIENKDVVSLVVLYNEGLVIGRALLWKLTNGISFMDRIYANQDSVIESFITYAIDNSWYYKKSQSSDINTVITNSKSNLNVLDMKVQLGKFKFEFYPYMDTFKYMTSSGILHANNNTKSIYLMRGELGEKFNCHECDGDIEIICVECLGEDPSCETCDGIGEVTCQECKNIN